jgi:hypothetical protein
VQRSQSATKKLARYRAALEAGTDPALIAEWTQQVKAERAVIDARIRPGAAAHAG